MIHVRETGAIIVMLMFQDQHSETYGPRQKAGLAFGYQ